MYHEANGANKITDSDVILNMISFYYFFVDKNESSTGSPFMYVRPFICNGNDSTTVQLVRGQNEKQGDKCPCSQVIKYNGM